jgi:DNA replicative helicase MCM subunit Mcm2 (Cdc46/Mcm family)
MACFYAMNELPVPFERQVLFSVETDKLEKAKDATKLPLRDGKSITISPGTVTTTAELTPRELFTLRVCKDCRAAWMAAISTWFTAEPRTVPSCGSGIYVREHGTNVEITREEWDEKHRRAFPGDQ